MRVRLLSWALGMGVISGTAFAAGDGVLTFPGASGSQEQDTPTLPAPNPSPQFPQPTTPQPQFPQTPGPGTPQPAGGQTMNHIFVCQSADQSRITLRTDTSGNVHLKDPQSGESATGTYTYTGAELTLAVPAYSFRETTVQLQAAKGLLLAFETSTVYCWLLGHEMGEAVQGYVKCPTIGYIAGIGWQDNAFQFFQDHSVKWRSWDEYVAISDTTYTESYGTYLIEGNQISMAFGGRKDKNFLNGVIGTDGSLSINELEPDKGPCRPE